MKKTCGMHFCARALTKRKHSGVNNEYGVNRIGRQTVFTMEYFWRFNRFLFLSIFLCGGVPAGTDTAMPRCRQVRAQALALCLSGSYCPNGAVWQRQDVRAVCAKLRFNAGAKRDIFCVQAAWLLRVERACEPSFWQSLQKSTYLFSMVRFLART